MEVIVGPGTGSGAKVRIYDDSGDGGALLSDEPLANAFNALVATSYSGVKSCPPPSGSGTYTISFGPSATQAPDFVAQGPGCGWDVTWAAKSTGELEGSGTLDSLLSSLVGP